MPSASASTHELPINAMLPLDCAEIVWKVESGLVGVYSVEQEGGRLVGARRYLFDVPRGGLLFAGDHPRKQLLLVTKTPATVTQFSADQIAEHGGSYQTAISRWVHELSLYWVADSVSSSPVPLNRTVSVSQGEFIHITAELALTQMMDGRVSVKGSRQTIEPESGPLLIDRSSWLQALEVSRLKFWRIDDAPLPELLAGLKLLTTLFLSQLIDVKEQAEQHQVERLQSRETLVSGESATALRLIGESWDRGIAPSRGISPLWSVLGVIGQELSLNFHESSARTKSRRATSLPADQTEVLVSIMHASRVRTRLVLLTKGWFRSDGGPLIGRLQDKNRPIALLWRNDRYVVVDPADGTTEVIDESLDLRLAPHAVSVIRPLPEKEKFSFVRLIARAALRYRRDLLALAALWCLFFYLNYISPSSIKPVIDNIVPNARYDQLLGTGIYLTLISVGLAGVTLCQRLFLVRVQSGTTIDAQMAVMDRVLRLPQKYLSSFSGGDLASRVMIVTELSNEIGINAVFCLLVSIGTLCSRSPYFTSSVLAWIPLTGMAVTFTSAFINGRRIRTLSAQLNRKSGELFGMTVQLVQGVSKLLVSGAKQRAFNHWAIRYGEQLRMVSEIQRCQNRLKMINGFVDTTGLMLIVHESARYLGTSSEVASGAATISLGKFMLVYIVFRSILSEVRSISENTVNLLDHWTRRRLLEPLLETPIESDTAKADPGELAGSISVKNVWFRYRSDGPGILNGLTIDVQPGEFIAVVGPSGGGKSTLFKLLLGFERSDSGSIYYDGQDLAGLDANAIRRQVGAVIPDGQINNGTLFDNIAVGRKVSLADAWEAVRDAGLDPEIKRLPMGLHTVINEGATTFSGGQRQRLLIARALAGNPKILLFDEATSALDNKTQDHIAQSLRRRKVTRIVISQRLSAISGADRIYVLNAGQIAQIGTFEELSANSGYFRELAQYQIA